MGFEGAACDPRCVFVSSQVVPVESEGNGLQRHKREWITAPRRLLENNDYTGLEFIAKIRSDKENFTKIRYSLTGPGVDQNPVGVFGVDPNTGFVKVYTILDREKVASYHLKGIAKYMDGTRAEKDIDLIITVEDVNDCPPVIQMNQVGSVKESSAAGKTGRQTVVIATDADEANTLHSQVHYSIVEQSNVGGMFSINSRTGEIIVQRNTLDRETKDTYNLMIKASDLNGASGGNSGTGQVQIKLLDINDNIPTLEKDTYVGSVEENTVNVEVLRIQAIDKDMMYTENWEAVYEIVSGNEGGYFTITTDSKTNEGIIMINKALDYEELKTLNLDVAVSNKAAYSSSVVVTGKSYPITINVVNQKEGPRFQPTVKVVTISEDQSSVSINKVIASYAAIDSDTLQTATNVRYAKIRDEQNLLIIDERTADIRLTKVPDRESKYLKNGTYYAEIICISDDKPSKTATGTIAIQVEDFNDNCPTLTATTQTMCLDDNVIYVTAVDEDLFPNSYPFEFSVVSSSSSGKWMVEPLNATTVILRDQANLWPGHYKVMVEIKDQQGKVCAEDQIIDLTVCTCHEVTRTCSARNVSTAGLGAAGILLLLLGLLLLLLIPCLLLFCLCGGTAAIGDFKAMPFETKQQLISYHTEGQGEDKVLSSAQQLPLQIRLGGGAGFGMNTSTLVTENINMYNQYRRGGGLEEMDMMQGQGYGYSHYSGGAFDGMALSEQFLGEYYSSKSSHAAQQPQQKDSFLVYDYEGRESLAGSVSSCSLLENDNDLSFLDDLGPKFKTLADICQGTVVTETEDVTVSVPPIRPSTSTHIHTHTETVRDRDRLGINTLNTSNVASGSSTFIQESFTKRAQGLTTVPNTVLIQQPAMYYTAAPMYVVESQPQVMLVAGGAQQATGQVGLTQGLVQVGGLQGSQGVVLVDRQTGPIGAAGQSAAGLSTGTTSRSRQVLLVENGSSGREHAAARGFAQVGRDSVDHGLEVKGQAFQMHTSGFSMGSRGSAGSTEDFTMAAAPKAQGAQRVVVQRKKVSVTERNVESTSRA
uniref:Desmoglein-2-like n=1 Tax=Salarias fasciatus TaxID=181472 RepID=A0A672G470_SALFA